MTFSNRNLQPSSTRGLTIFEQGRSVRTGHPLQTILPLRDWSRGKAKWLGLPGPLTHHPTRVRHVQPLVPLTRDAVAEKVSAA